MESRREEDGVSLCSPDPNLRTQLAFWIDGTVDAWVDNCYACIAGSLPLFTHAFHSNHANDFWNNLLKQGLAITCVNLGISEWESECFLLKIQNSKLGSACCRLKLIPSGLQSNWQSFSSTFWCNKMNIKRIYISFFNIWNVWVILLSTVGLINWTIKKTTKALVFIKSNGVNYTVF